MTISGTPPSSGGPPQPLRRRVSRPAPRGGAATRPAGRDPCPGALYKARSCSHRPPTAPERRQPRHTCTGRRRRLSAARRASLSNLTCQRSLVSPDAPASSHWPAHCRRLMGRAEIAEPAVYWLSVIATLDTHWLRREFLLPHSPLIGWQSEGGESCGPCGAWRPARHGGAAPRWRRRLPGPEGVVQAAMWGAGPCRPTGTWGQGEGPPTGLPAPRQAYVRTSVASLCRLLVNRSRVSTDCADVCCPFILSCISTLRFAAVGCVDCDCHPPDSLRLFIKICEVKMRKCSESGHLVAL